MPLSSPIPTINFSPTCYEPTSGPYSKPLSVAACMNIVNMITADFADITWDLTHGPPVFWDWIHCPLYIERGGCFFRMDYLRPSSLQSMPLECPRHVMISALLVVITQCVFKNNVDGGEIVLKIPDGSAIAFSLTHPPATLSGGNKSFIETADVDSNLLLDTAEQGIAGSS